MAYRKNADRDEDKAKAYELEQVIVTDISVLSAQYFFLNYKTHEEIFVCAEQFRVQSFISAIGYFMKAFRWLTPHIYLCDWDKT